MSYSIRRYTGTGTPQVLDVPPYLDKSHIKVYVAGVLTPGWTWTTSQTITITAASGAAVVIQRLTSPEARLTDYLSGATLTEDVLDQDSLQAFYMGQEARDVYDDIAGYALAPLTSAASAAVQANVSAAAASASASAASAAALSVTGLVAANNARTVPSAVFNWFSTDFTVTACPVSGHAAVLQDIGDVFVNKFGVSGLNIINAGVYYVAPWGSDSNSGVTWSDALATPGKAIKNTVCGTIYIWAGTYSATGFTYVDSGGLGAKRIIGVGTVLIKYPGDDLGAATWTPNATYPYIYQTTLSTANQPKRVLTTSALDKYGLPLPLPLAAAFGTTTTTAVTALAVARNGWFYDTATKILYVGLGGQNINTTGVKSTLQASYSPGGDNQVLLQSTRSYWENIIFQGNVFILKTAGQITPEGWFKNCQVRYADSNSFTVEGGVCFTQDCTAYRSTADHANYNISSGVASQGLEINFRTQYAGDADTYGSGTSQPNNAVSTLANKNGSSNHDSTVVRINGLHTESYGPAVADASYAWNLGVKTGYVYAGGFRAGFYNAGTAWLDSCQSLGGVDSGFYTLSTGVVKLYNPLGTIATEPGGSATSYVPT